MNSEYMYAIYENKEYRCGTLKGGEEIKLYSQEELPGFVELLGTYYKIVKRQECLRVYRKTLCFRYDDDNFLVRDEKGDMLLLETGPRAYDLLEKGFERVLHDTFQKWVPLSAGEKYWVTIEY